MDIVEAINKRKSIREFKPDPVPQPILKEMIETAVRAPSWANTQPWEFAIATGRILDEIKQNYLSKAPQESVRDITPPFEFQEPYDSRRREVGAKNLAAKGIGRDDREKRELWRLHGLRNFGAICVIYIYIDRSLYTQSKGLNVWPVFDCALVAENIMLVAVSHGLGTIPQASAVAYPEVLRKVLKLPDSKLMVLGIAVGYPDFDDPVNQYRTGREQIDRIVKWYGFA